MPTYKKRSNLAVGILALVFCVTNISQMPMFIDLSITRYISIPLWITVTFFVVLFARFTMPTNVVLVAMLGVVVLLWQIFGTLVSNNAYFTSTLTYSFYLSIFIMVVGAMFHRLIDRQGLKTVFLSYIISALVVTVSIYIEYFRDANLFQKQEYLYASKNSISMIVVTALILLLVTKFNYRHSFVLKWTGVIFFTYVLVLMKSRASILAFAVVVVILLFNARADRNVRIVIVAALLVFAALMIMSDSVYDFVVNNLILNFGRVENLDSVSSGRLSLVEQALEAFKGNEIMGVGEFYVDCFFLCAVVENGIFGGFIMIVVAFIPLLWCICGRWTDKSPLLLALLLVSVAYLINAVFECVAPFGPGTKCYMLWFLFGYLMQCGGSEKLRASAVGVPPYVDDTPM